MPLGREVDLGAGDIVTWGPRYPDGAQPPKLSADVCCGQTASWSKMPLRREVGRASLQRGSLLHVPGDMC